MDEDKIRLGRQLIPNETVMKAQPFLYPRYAKDRIATALADTPVVMVNGPRQCGKTTLVRELETDGRRYFTLDDEAVLASVRADPGRVPLRGVASTVAKPLASAPSTAL